LLYCLLVIISLPVSLSWLSYNPLAQTFFARLTSSYLSEQLNTVVKIDGMHITLRLDLRFWGVLVLDQHSDTLFSADNLVVDMRGFALKSEKKIFDVNSISLTDASFALIKGKNDSVFTYDFIRDHFESVDTTTAADTIHGPASWQVSLSGLQLENVRFRYVDENRDPIPVGMDYQNLDIIINELSMHDLHILNDTFDFTIEKLVCHDRCGFAVDDMSGFFRLSPLFLIADSLKVKTPHSDLNLDLAFYYEGWPSYIRFTEEVDMQAFIRPSEFNFRDAGYFAPEIMVMDNRVRIGGKVKGPVNNLRVTDFRLAYGRNTRFHGDVKLYGLPDVRETFIHTSIREFILEQSDITQFALPGSTRYIAMPPELKPLGSTRIKGSFTGFYNDFVATADFRSEIGSVSTDVILQQDEMTAEVTYRGKVRARKFNIGKFLNLSDYFGLMDLDAVVDGSGLTGETVAIEMTGNLSSLEFTGNEFNQIDISGEIADKKFNGHLGVNDDLIKLIFDGILDFRQEKPIFDFTADIGDADLFALNLLDRDSLMKLDVKLTCNFIGSELDDLEGRIIIDSMKYLEGDNRWFMERLALISLKDTGYYKRMMLTSDMLDATIKGSFTYRELIHAINIMVAEQLPEWSFIDKPLTGIRKQRIEFDLRLKETEPITEIFIPGLYVMENGIINGYFRFPEKVLAANASFPLVSYYGMYADGLVVAASAENGLISADITTDRIVIKERELEDTLQLGLENFALKMGLADDSLKFGLLWDDHDAVLRNKATINGYYTFIDSIRSEMRFDHAEMFINDSLWTISKGNRMIFGPRYYQFRDIAFIGGQQRLDISGVISERPEDTLRLDFERWRLSNFDIIYDNYDFDLNGTINGYFGVGTLYETPNFMADLIIQRLEMNRVLIGDAHMLTSWNPLDRSVDINAEIIHHGNVAESKVVDLKGSYYPERKNDNLDFTLKIENFRMAALERFVNNFISELSGIASGSFNISGSDRAPLLTGWLKLMRTECRVDYLNTKYSLAHTIEFKPEAIVFDDLVVFDSLGNQAVATGQIKHKNLGNIYIDITVKPNDFLCMKTDRYQNNAFYGTAIASGEVKFYGPPDNFHIDADVVTSKGTDFVIPLNTSITVTENDFVVFRNVAMDQQDLASQEYKVDLQGLSLDFRIGVTNTAETMIFLPSNMGNISSKGFGDIRLTINRRGEFNIYGDYNFLRGTFFFTLQNLINKRFEIMQGGKISFAGNPYDAEVDLKALYRLKTTLSGLGANISPEYEGQRVNVNAYLGLRGRLANPDIHFSISFPNVQDEVRQTIYAILDTNDAALMNQQMISLLLMNNFSYASSSGSMGASSLNIISSQLSNWLSQISSDFDIGINYISGDEITQDELEVALSTQFFDNRLIVDGNVGVITKDNQQQQASNIVGDVNIEYKLTPDGKIRLRAFNRSNNFNSIDYYAPYTQGIGIFYTRDFDRFGDIFRRRRR
jgi:hypothetical protein